MGNLGRWSRISRIIVYAGVSHDIMEEFKYSWLSAYEQFGDGTHFTGDYANQEHYNEIIKEMYSDDSLINFIRFE